MGKFSDLVSAPARYVGGEFNTPDMDKPCSARVCMCVSDTYEVGMSNLGVRILYYLFNSLSGVVCERCFSPWFDYEKYLLDNNLPLCSLETQRPLFTFDFVGFSMQYELCYANFFQMLELGHIPVYADKREEGCPFVVAGGPCAVNLEPLYKFFDFIFVGDGETPWPKIVADWQKMKCKVTRKEFLKHVADTYACIYVPSLVDAVYVDGKVSQKFDVVIEKNSEKDLNATFTPDRQLMPTLEIIHDRAVVELARGCANGCRFCQAGFLYRPVRERSVENVVSLCQNLYKNTGYKEISLNSLSAGDYSNLQCLVTALKPFCDENKVKLSLPSLRVDSFKGEFASENRKSSLTFAPEAGSERLRRVINKNITEEDIMTACREAFSQGFSSVKLYFMLGLPTETMDDVKGIADLTYAVKDLYRELTGKFLRVSVSAATFIPKPFTPFMWEAFASREDVENKQNYLKERFRKGHVDFSYTDYETSTLEALLARGGRNLADSLYAAYQKGARFDAWSEHFNWNFYREAFEENGVDITKEVAEKSEDEVLPWDMISVGVDKRYFLSERHKAYEAISTPSCTKQCNGCGLKKRGFCTEWEGNRKL